MRGLDDGPDGLNDAAFERAMSAPSRRYIAHFGKTARGYDWSVTDARTDRTVASGWCAGPRRDAQAEATLAISELRS